MQRLCHLERNGANYLQINELKQFRRSRGKGVECRILEHSCACSGGCTKGSQLFNQLFINGLYKPRSGSEGHVARFATRVSLCDTKGNGRKWARAVESRRGGPASAARRQAEKPEGNSGNRGRGAGVEPGWTAVRGTRQPAARARTMATSGLRIGRLTRSRWCSLLRGALYFKDDGRRLVRDGVGMRYDGTPVRQPSPGRTGDLSWRGQRECRGIGERHGPHTPASGSLPPCPSHRRSLSQPESLIERDREPVGHRPPPETPGSPAPPRSAARQRFPARKG